MRYVLVCDGASASSRDSAHRVAGIVRGVLYDKRHDICIHEIERTLLDRKTDKELGRFLRNVSHPELLIVCKSQGADRVIRHLNKNKYPDLVIRVIAIDPHHWADGVRRLFKRPGLAIAGGINCVNYYQLNEWPKGCKIDGALNLQLENVNHWNIIFHKSIKRAIRLWG